MRVAWAKCDYSPLKTANSVMIVADRDKPGLERAYGLYELFKSWGMNVYICHPKVGKDATDHVVAGFGIADFVDVAPPVIVDGEFESAVEDQLRRLMVVEEAKRRVAEAKAVEVGSKLAPKKLDELLKLNVTYDWLVPNLLERKDRLIVTGGEGSGKSYLLRQMAVMMASGMHPFDKNRQIDPLRVASC